MTQCDPPRMATWMLRHLVSGERNDALAGDLLEEFRAGRSAAWYWRQVLACIVITNARAVVAQTGALLFAAFWALLAPVCIPLPPLKHFPLFEKEFWKLDAIWNLPYPWSNICNLGLMFLLMILFVWIGLLFYLALESITTRRFSFRRIRRGMVRTASVFIPLWFAAWSLPLIFPAAHFSSRVHALRLSPSVAHHPLGPFMLAESMCAPFFITLLWVIWDTSRTENFRKQPLQNRPTQRT